MRRYVPSQHLRQLSAPSQLLMRRVRDLCCADSLPSLGQTMRAQESLRADSR